MSGRLVAVTETTRDAAALIGVGVPTLSRHLNNRRGTCGGYIARFTNEVPGLTQLPENQTYFPNEQRSQLRPVGQYDMEGNLLSVHRSRKDAEMATGVNRSQISACCIGEQKSAGGFMWRDFEDGKDKIEPFFREKSEYVKSLAKPVSCYIPGNNKPFRSFGSSREAAKELGISDAAIWKSVHYGWKAAGFIWKYD